MNYSIYLLFDKATKASYITERNNIYNFLSMETGNYDIEDESAGVFGRQEALDRIVARAMRMSEGWEALMKDSDLLVSMCGSACENGFSVVCERGIYWSANESHYDGELAQYPGAAVIRISDSGLRIIVENPDKTDREDFRENVEYQMTRAEFIDEIRNRL